jgi:hypothetical protein
LGFDGVPSYYNILTNSFAIKFVENGSAYGGNGNGLGDYKLQTTSPVINPYLIGPVLLPYDIAGVARGGMDPIGANLNKFAPRDTDSVAMSGFGLVP